MNQLDLFYNTINLTDPALHRARIKAGTQNAEILEFFKAHKQEEFTPAEINQHLNYKWPFTSVRRAISTLTDLGYLEKTEFMRKGLYDKPNFCWRLKINFDV